MTSSPHWFFLGGDCIHSPAPSRLIRHATPVVWFLVRHNSRAEDGGNPLLQAVRSGPQAMELLSEPLVLDYLGLKFSRTLPSWNTQHPFERNINQAFYSYTLVPCTGAVNAKDVPRDFFQRLLL